MKSKRKQQIEILFCSALAMAVGFSIGYYQAAVTAAEHVRAILK